MQVDTSYWENGFSYCQVPLLIVKLLFMYMNLHVTLLCTHMNMDT